VSFVIFVRNFLSLPQKPRGSQGENTQSKPISKLI
jgi:hypothetical protein